MNHRDNSEWWRTEVAPHLYPLTRAQDICPMCLKPGKGSGIIVHYGWCYRGTGFKDGDPLAEATVKAFEDFLRARRCLAVPIEEVSRCH